MTKLLLAAVVLFAMTACDERVGRGIKAPTPMPLSMQSTEEMTEDVTEKEMPTLPQSEEVVVMNDVPILEDELPTLPTPTELEEPITTEKGMAKVSKVVTSPTSTKGLDIADIRISSSPERTRLVFDSYNNGTKTSVSGAYSYSYDVAKKIITLTLTGYKNISALDNAKTRNYHGLVVKKIYLANKGTDTLKCIIALKKDANINIFDINEPARIVIDIFPR